MARRKSNNNPFDFTRKARDNDPFKIGFKPIKISGFDKPIKSDPIFKIPNNSSIKLPKPIKFPKSTITIPKPTSVFGGVLNPQTSAYKRISSTPSRVIRPEIRPMIKPQTLQPIKISDYLIKKSQQRRIEQRQSTQPTGLTLLEKIRRLDQLAQQPQSQEHISKIYEEIANLRKELTGLENIKRENLELKESMGQIMEIMKEILKREISRSQNSTDSSLNNAKNMLLSEIEIKQVKTQLSLLETKWNIYEPDIEHLHRTNQDNASDTTNE